MFSLSRFEDSSDQPSIGRSADILLWLVLAAFVSAILWAALAEVEQSVRAPGQVRTDLDTQIVSNLEGGVVAELFVKEGDTVKKGKPLMRLDPTATESEYGNNRSQVNALRAKIARLSAEVQGKRPDWNSGGTAVAIEKSLYNSRSMEFSSGNSANFARVNEAQRAVEEARATLAARRAAAAGARERVAMIRPLVDKGIEPRAELANAERELAVASSETSAASASLARAQATVAEASASARREQGRWRSQAADELAAAQRELDARLRNMPALRERVDRTILRAPRDGKVHKLYATTIGGTVGAGDPLADIVPDHDTLVVEARVRPQDIGQIRIDQPAIVNITAYDSSIYGGLDGKVASISPDIQTEERTGENFYVVRVRTDRPALITKNNRRLPLGAGMMADVNLLGESRSVLSYILTPITRLTKTALRE